MTDLSDRQHIPYDGELFTLLSGEQMGISHRHCDILMAHELLQLHKRDLAGLSKPRGERMPHGMQCDHIQAVAVFWLQTEFSDGGFETRGSFSEGCFLAGLLENGFCRLALIRLEHPDHILRHSDENSFASFLDDIKAAGVSIHVLSAQLENFRGAEAGSQGEQSHVMQLRMPLFKVVQKGLGLFPCQKAQSFIVGFDHFPCTTFGGQRVDTAPHTCSESTIYGGSHERKDIVYSLTGQSFPLPYLGVGLSCGLFGLCIPGKRLQELCLETGEQIRGQLDNWQGVNFVLEVSAVLTVMLIDVLPFASAPGKIRIDDFTDGDFLALDSGNARDCELGKELFPFLFDRGRADALAVPPDSFPMTFTLVIGIPKGVDAIHLAVAGVALGRLAVEHAIELGFNVFSGSCVAHKGNVPGNSLEGKMLIQNLSKMDFLDEDFGDNYLELLIIMFYLLAMCDRERERESVCVCVHIYESVC